MITIVKAEVSVLRNKEVLFCLRKSHRKFTRFWNPSGTWCAGFLGVASCRHTSSCAIERFVLSSLFLSSLTSISTTHRHRSCCRFPPSLRYRAASSTRPQSHSNPRADKNPATLPSTPSSSSPSSPIPPTTRPQTTTTSVPNLEYATREPSNSPADTPSAHSGTWNPCADTCVWKTHSGTRPALSILARAARC